jgi:hypothetical protein
MMIQHFLLYEEELSGERFDSPLLLLAEVLQDVVPEQFVSSEVFPW